MLNTGDGFINMLKELNTNNIFRNLLDQIESSQKIREFMSDTISGNISLQTHMRSRFAAADEDDEKMCGLCYEKYEGEHTEQALVCRKKVCKASVILPCLYGKSHKYCHSCLAKWEKNKRIICPQCRSDFASPLVRYAHAVEEESDVTQCLRCLRESGVGRFLMIYAYAFIILVLWVIIQIIREDLFPAV